MTDFIEIINNILVEQNKTKEDLFVNNIVSPNTFFKYRKRYPSLRTLINIANYLKVSLDYIFELSSDNTFSKNYEYRSEIFYNNLNTFLEIKKISGRQFCKALNYSRDNLSRWKRGIVPSVINVIEIAKYLECHIDDLLF